MTSKVRSIDDVPRLSFYDLSQGTTEDKIEFIEHFGRAVFDIGFVVLEGGIPIELVTKVYRIMDQVFALPTEDLNKFRHESWGHQVGYMPPGTETASDSIIKIADHKMCWHIKNGMEFPHQWPPEIHGFNDVLRLYTILRNRLIRLFTCLEEFMGLPTGHYTHALNRSDSDHFFRLMKYILPQAIKDALKQAQPEDRVNIMKALMWAGPHDDDGHGTILPPGRDQYGKLQIRLSERDDPNEVWESISLRPHESIFNTGYYFMLETMHDYPENGIAEARFHRVVFNDEVDLAKLTPEEVDNFERDSMAFFIHPYTDHVIAGRTARNILNERLDNIGMGEIQQ